MARPTITRRRRFLAGQEEQHPLPVAAAAVIEEGDIVACAADGLAIRAARTAGLGVQGVCVRGFDNTGGAAGNLTATGSIGSAEPHVVVERNLRWSFLVAQDGGPAIAAGVKVYVKTHTSVTTSTTAPAIEVGHLDRPDENASGYWYLRAAGARS